MTPPPGLPSTPHIRTALYTIGGLAVGVFLIGAVFLGIQTYLLTGAVREAQIDNSQRAEDTRSAAEDAARTAQRIEDCTTPGRACFDENAERTAGAIVGINRGTLVVITAALSCQDDGITEQKALAKCTARRARASTDR